MENQTIAIKKGNALPFCAINSTLTIKFHNSIPITHYRPFLKKKRALQKNAPSQKNAPLRFFEFFGDRGIWARPDFQKKTRLLKKTRPLKKNAPFQKKRAFPLPFPLGGSQKSDFWRILQIVSSAGNLGTP